MKRVLYVHHNSTLGGATLSLLYLIDQLDRKRYEPSVLFNSPPGQAIELFRSRGIKVFVDEKIGTYGHGQGAWLSLRSPHPWEILTKALEIRPSAHLFYQFLQHYPIDLVHLNSMVQVPAAMGTSWAKIPLVWHIREEMHPGYLGIRRALLRHYIRLISDVNIVISQRNASQLLPSPKIHVVYNFVDFDHFDRNISSQRLRNELGLPDEQIIVGMLGGVISSKGADVFVEAASLVHRQRHDILFLIAGVAPNNVESPSRLKRALRRFGENIGYLKNPGRRALSSIKRNGLEKIVRFIGMRSDVPDVLAACSILVWPAIVSHFARPIIEAGAMARPVIASDFPSSREIVKPNLTGLLFPPGDASALANAILRLLDDPGEASRMGEAGYVLARERYDARVNAAATFAVYEDVLRQRLDSTL